MENELIRSNTKGQSGYACPFDSFFTAPPAPKPALFSGALPLQSILIWHVLVFAAMFMKADDFTMGIVNWYTLSILVMVVGILVFYPLMERKRKQSAT